MEKAILLIIGVGNIIFGGFVFSCLWGWFIVPFGMMDIGTAWAIGISAAISGLKGAKIRKEDASELLIHSISMNITVLLIGFISSLFM